MLDAQVLEINNVVTYSRARVSLNAHPLVRVSGNNGAGKSVLFNTLGSVLFNFVRTQSKKNEKSALFTDTSSSASVTLVKNDTRYRITQYFKGTTRWEIERNGKKLKFREKEGALNFIRTKIFNLTEQQVYSQVLVDGRTKTILQSGNSKQRFEYFENVFRLKAYDALAVPVNREYQRLKVALQELDVITGEWNHKQSEQPDGDVEALEKKQKRFEREFRKVRDQIDGLLQQNTTVSTFINIAEGITRRGSLNQLREDLQEAEKEQIKIDELHEKAIQWKEQRDAHQALEEKRKSFQERLKEIPKPNIRLEEAQQKLDALKTKLEILKEKVNQERQNKQARKQLQEELEKLRHGNEFLFDRYQSTPTKRIEHLIQRNKAEKGLLQASLDSLSVFIQHSHTKDEHCPTCRRGLTQDQATLIMESTEKNIAKLQNTNKKLAKLLIYNEKSQELKNLAPICDLFETKTLIQRLEEKGEYYKETIANGRKRQKLREFIKNLPPSNFDSEVSRPPPHVYTELKKDLRARIESIKQTLYAFQRLKKLNLLGRWTSVKQAQEEKETIEQQLAECRPSLDLYQKRISQLEGTLSVWDMVHRDLTRLGERIDQLKLDTRDWKIFGALRKAFGPRGLRKIKTAYYAKKLMHNMNKYATFIFKDPIKFKINVSQTNLDILAERSGKISDVRSLSGAESSAFTLLQILCILPFIPSQDRCNFIVLDETEVGMDEHYKQLYINRYLPLLQQIVPHIFIVSPQDEKSLYVPNAHTWHVTKKKGISTVTER